MLSVLFSSPVVLTMPGRTQEARKLLEGKRKRNGIGFARKE
jgi:hypothetical protein